MDADVIAVASVAVLASGLGAMAWIDFKTGYLPDLLQIFLAVTALVVLAIDSPIGIGWTGAILGMIINTTVFWGLRWIVSRAKGREAMGLGDVKLVGVAGLWLGPWALPYIMALAGFLTLAAVGVASLIKRKALWREEMPLGPGLAVGILAAYLAALGGMSGIVGPAAMNTGL